MSDEQKIIRHLKKKLPEHIVEHSLRVATIAQNLAAEEDADEDICFLAGLFHDLGYQKGIAGHAKTGAELAEKFMEKHKLFPRIREEILLAVRTHMLDPKPETLEGWIVSDADSIERIGPIGIHRSYIGGLHWAGVAPEEMPEYLRAALESAKDLYTRTAKDFARKDIAYMKQFLKRLEEDSAVEE